MNDHKKSSRQALRNKAKSLLGSDEGGPEMAPITEEALRERDINGGFSSRIAIFSMGNPMEAHGPALPPDVDDRTGSAIAVMVANAIGARFVSHIPFATDGVGMIAEQWSPQVVPFDDFYAQMRDFIGDLLPRFFVRNGEPGLPDLVVIISGHGGNNELEKRLDRLAEDLGVRKCLYFLSLQVPELEGELKDKYGKAVLWHCDTVEHSAAKVLGEGCFNAEKLAEAAAGLDDDETLIRTMLKYPAFGGMAGLVTFGGEAFDELVEKYPGFERGGEEFCQKRTVKADTELGEAIIRHSILAIAASITREAVGLGIRPPLSLRGKGQRA